MTGVRARVDRARCSAVASSPRHQSGKSPGRCTSVLCHEAGSRSSRWRIRSCSKRASRLLRHHRFWVERTQRLDGDCLRSRGPSSDPDADGLGSRADHRWRGSRAAGRYCLLVPARASARSGESAHTDAHVNVRQLTMGWRCSPARLDRSDRTPRRPLCVNDVSASYPVGLGRARVLGRGL